VTLPSGLGGRPSATWPTLFLESFPCHATKSAFAFEAPRVTGFNARPVGIYGHTVKGRYDAIGHLVLPAFWPCHSDSLAVDLQQVSFSDVVCERISAKTSMISMILRSCRFKQLLSAAVYTDLQQYDIVPM
jgi:hypothetical protein